MRRDGAEIRKERMEEIARTIQRQLKNQGEIPLSKTLAAFAYAFGLREETVTEYLEILENLEQFVLDKEHDKIKRISEG